MLFESRQRLLPHNFEFGCWEAWRGGDFRSEIECWRELFAQGLDANAHRPSPTTHRDLALELVFQVADFGIGLLGRATLKQRNRKFANGRLFLQ